MFKCVKVGEKCFCVRGIRAVRLFLVKCFDNKMVKSPYNWVIFSLDSASGGEPTKKKKTIKLPNKQINMF